MRFLTVMTLSLLVGCSTGAPPAGGGETMPDPSKSPEEAATTETTAAPAEGEAAGAEPGGEDGEAEPETEAVELPSAAKLDEAKGLARAMMPKQAMLDAVKPVLGEPSAMTDTEAHWVGKEGDACKMLKVTLMGDMVGSASVEDTECPSGDAE